MGRKKKVFVARNVNPEVVLSHPTMCLHCHLIVEMTHPIQADPVKGAWVCPRCQHKYPFTHWRIKKQSQHTDESNPDSSNGIGQWTKTQLCLIIRGQLLVYLEQLSTPTSPTTGVFYLPAKELVLVRANKHSEGV